MIVIPLLDTKMFDKFDRWIKLTKTSPNCLNKLRVRKKPFKIELMSVFTTIQRWIYEQSIFKCIYLYFLYPETIHSFIKNKIFKWSWKILFTLWTCSETFVSSYLLQNKKISHFSIILLKSFIYSLNFSLLRICTYR